MNYGCRCGYSGCFVSNPSDVEGARVCRADMAAWGRGLLPSLKMDSVNGVLIMRQIGGVKVYQELRCQLVPIVHRGAPLGFE